MTDNELLLALSTLFDKKLKPIEQRLTSIELTLENEIKPQLQNIQACYTSTFDRYKNQVEGYEAMQSDIDIIKKVVTEHSEKLQKIS
ncbi:MAG: hypothetical protein HFI16_04660 [Lachnospiraceae bacterium]|nr:hypothetical protein [Lachnospiraceae bacterium]